MNLDLNNPTDLKALRECDIRRALGNELKIQREKRGISVRDVSSETRIPIRSLEAIESGDYGLIPGGTDYDDRIFAGVYVRGFLRIYARFLKLDSQIRIDFDLPPITEAVVSSDLTVRPARSALSQSESECKLEPPKLGEYLLYLLLTKPERIYVIGDLREEYREIAVRFGARKATLWFYKQVLTSLWPLICRSLSKIRLIITLVDLIRQIK